MFAVSSERKEKLNQKLAYERQWVDEERIELIKNGFERNYAKPETESYDPATRAIHLALISEDILRAGAGLISPKFPEALNTTITSLRSQDLFVTIPTVLNHMHIIVSKMHAQKKSGSDSLANVGEAFLLEQIGLTAHVLFLHTNFADITMHY